MEKYYSTFEVAKICQVSPGSVIRWVREGKLAAAFTAGGHHRIRADHLVELLKSLRISIPPSLAGWKKDTTILIVDDEVGVRELLRSLLQKYYPDFHIEEADEGFLAGWKAHGLHPDLVLLDILLPGIDGIRVCEFIRRNAELKYTKIIAVTAVEDPAVREKILKCGADDFILKPFDLTELRRKIDFQLGLQKKEVAAL